MTSPVSHIRSVRAEYRRPLSVWALILLMVSVVSPLTVRAQSSDSAASSAPKQEKTTQSAAAPAPTYQPLKLGSVTLSGSLRGRMENWGWFEAPPGDDHYTFGAFNLRVALEQKKERFEWRIEGLFPWLISLPYRRARRPVNRVSCGAPPCVLSSAS